MSQPTSGQKIDREIMKIFQPCTIIAIVIIGIFGGAVPYMFRRKNQAKFLVAVSYLNCVSGGILIGVAFLDVLPTTGANLNAAVHEFPLSYYITAAIIFLMTLVLKLGHNHHHDDHNVEKCGNHNHDHEHEHEHECDKCSNVRESTIIYEQDSKDQHMDVSTIQIDTPSTSSDKLNVTKNKPKRNWMTLTMLLLGLMIHDVSEGFALGFSQALDQALTLFIGIALHKWCDVMIEVVAGLKNNLSLTQNICLIASLALGSPVAQAIAYLIVYFTKTGRTKVISIVEDVFMSMAAGTFISIGFVEVIAEEFNHLSKGETLKKSLAVLSGIVFIGIVIIIEHFLNKHLMIEQNTVVF